MLIRSIVQFSRYSAVRFANRFLFLPPFQTACLLYHILSLLSIPFFNFFKKFLGFLTFLSFYVIPPSFLSDSSSIISHLFRFVNTFFQLFSFPLKSSFPSVPSLPHQHFRAPHVIPASLAVSLFIISLPPPFVNTIFSLSTFRFLFYPLFPLSLSLFYNIRFNALMRG